MSPAHLIIGLTLATAIAATFWRGGRYDELSGLLPDDEPWGDPYLPEGMKAAARNQAGSGLTRRPSDTLSHSTRPSSHDGQGPL
jgi:hypothetical protein